MRKVIHIICGLSLGLCVVAHSVMAAENIPKDTVNDVLDIYHHNTLKGIRELREKYEAAYKEYEELYKETQVSEIYNEMLMSASMYKEAAAKELQREVDFLINENKQISTQIGTTIYGEISTLIELDLEYKVNVDKVNLLLRKKNSYELTEAKEVDSETLDALEAEIKELQDAYNTSIDVSVLGDVYNVKYPLGKESRVSSPYGYRLDPMNPTTVRFHSGVDLKASMNTEVLSIFNGVITDAGYGPLGGYYVKIDHGNGLSSYYCHLNSIQCSVGQEVKQYDRIALSGNTGLRTTGPHLHFGLYINGNSVDPEILFNAERE